MSQNNNQEHLIREGDLIAFEGFYKINFERLVRYARLFLPEVDVCEDIVQESFYQIWTTRNGINPAQSLKAFLFTTVRNKCLNELKHRKIHDKFVDFLLHDEIIERFYRFDFEDEQNGDSDPHGVLINMVHEAINQLPPRRKKVYTMCKIEGLKNQEVARSEGISLKGVERHITKANKFINSYVKAARAMVWILAILFIGIRL